MGLGPAASVGALLMLIFSTGCSTAGGNSGTPSASAAVAHKPSAADIQVVGQGFATSPLDLVPFGMVLKNTNPSYAFTGDYQVTLYDAKGAQVGVGGFSSIAILPGETVVAGGTASNIAAAPSRLQLSPSIVFCAKRVVKPSQLPAPVQQVDGAWQVNPQNPRGFSDPPRGTVKGTLQVPTSRTDLLAQALLYDGAGRLTGFGSERLTSAQGSTAVLIRVQNFSNGTPNPWGPVVRATVSAYDDVYKLPSGALGDCQKLS